MKRLLELLGLGESKTTAHSDAIQSESIRQMVGELDELPEDEAGYVAAFAYLLARVANVDLEIDEAEKKRIEQVLVRYGLSPKKSAMVSKMAQSKAEVFGGTEDYLVTREINRLADRATKIDLMRGLFAVAAASGGISSLEARELRQIAAELRLEREEYVKLRVEFGKDLAVRSTEHDE
jgi:uncharacterized tellurite resistance protein B-like protein